jgi:hypothetical protein
MGIGLSTSFSFILLFFSHYSHTRQRAYAKYPYTVARRFSFFFFFLRIVVEQVIPSHVLVSFLDPEFRVSTIHPSSLAISRIGPWHSPIPSFYHLHGRSLYVLLSINMTQ